MSLLRIAAALVLAGLALAARAQPDFSKVEIQAHKLTESVYMLVGAGGNLGVCIGEDAVFVVDDQYAPMTEKITAAIAKLTPKPVKFVLNTHWHGDHTGGNENLARAGALVVAHENVRKRMTVDQFIEAFNMKVPPAPRMALPVATFAGAVSFHLNGDEIRSIHMPNAHTDGDSVVHFVRNDVIHMGDIYFNGMYPFIDMSSGGSVEGVIAAFDRVLGIATDRTKIIPGHGPLSDRAELQAHRDMLADVAGRIREMVRAGRRLEEIVAANLTAPYDERFGKGWIKGPKLVEMLAKDMIRR